MAAHDGVFGVSFVERSSLIRNRRAEKRCRMLIFQLLDAPCVRGTEKETDHPICVNTVNERIDNGSESGFAPQLFKEVRLCLGLHFSGQWFVPRLGK
jgi:hypothetical protein